MFSRVFPQSTRRVLALLAGLLLCVGAVSAADYNSVILAQVHAMPTGGQYSASRVATLKLQSAAHMESGKFTVLPNAASPSYCSGATYLVFLKTVEALRDHGALSLDVSALSALLIHGQLDGEGIWGRWNANGPGTARLFSELGLGRNFDRFEDAKPGDFMKIFWSPEVGRTEHGHSVVYLGTEMKDGQEYVRFWSSNIPAGYGEKSVPRTKVAFAIFSRLEHPEALARYAVLPRLDPYLASLTSTRSSMQEARLKSGF